MKLRSSLLGLALAAAPFAAQADNYLGILKLPRGPVETPDGLYSFSSTPVNTQLSAPGMENGYRLKLGYKYSRYFAVEGQVSDLARQADPFASPANLGSAFRSSGFGVDTIATLPLWRFSFYGRLGAYRGDARNAFSSYSTSLLADSGTRGTHLRYGLGMRYDFTKQLGVHAELERNSPLGSSFSPETDSDLLSVGVNWRF